ncbi:thioesterase family protein [Listeria sp. PSOL-1]|uniref:acyl-CoA thioesterase n=1 Tax=Listeria sp. PSOL-1 TaxID=1844999 RepID=UPI0013D2BCDD|nr:thioesterase family protein [Listeria sp. PSOL-1]
MAYSETTIEVRYAETDQMGVVYHANYLAWLEIGRKNFMDDLHLSYYEMEQEGYFMPVLDVSLHYVSPLRYGQNAVVRTWLKGYDGIRTIYGYEVRIEKTGHIALIGETKHACVRKDNFKPVAMRRVLKKWDNKYQELIKAGSEG